MVQSKQILQRISKFKVDPLTKKSELKSLHALNVLAKSRGTSNK